MRIIRISTREKMTVTHNGWTMTYYPDGNYFIYKNKKLITSGRYDAVLADSYNTGMTASDRKENLERDLISWVKKAIEGQVVD